MITEKDKADAERAMDEMQPLNAREQANGAIFKGMNPGDKVICVDSGGLHGPAAHPIRGLIYTAGEVRSSPWPSISLVEIPEAFWMIYRFKKFEENAR